MAPPPKSKVQKPDEDISQLRKPITLHGKPVEQILNSIHYGSPELRDLLLNECDMIFECKVCRALFRDLPNFISHKRRYCSTSVAEMNHFTFAESSEERVIIVQPQPVDESEIAKTQASSSSSHSNLEDTLQRIRTGDIGNSYAYQVYTNAAAKLRHQKDHARITSLRPREIPTNSNAVFVDVTSTSVNIHDRVKSAENDQIKLNKSNKRKTGASKKRVNASCTISAEKQLRSRASTNNNKTNNKKSDELTDRLIKELKVIQSKVKSKNPEFQQRLSEDQQPELVRRNPGSSRTSLKLKENDGIEPVGENCRVNGHCSTSIKVCKEDGLLKIAQQNLTNASMQMEKAVAESDVEESSPSSNVSSENEGDAVNNSGKESDGKSKRSLICPKCGGIFSSRKSLQFHIKTNHAVKRMFYPCPYCSNIYYYFKTITRHLQRNHDMTKKEVDEMRPTLRSKAFSKPSPSQDIHTRTVKADMMGSRRSLRYKDTLMNKKKGNTSFVYSSIMKGKKLSAIKDPLLIQKDMTPQNSLSVEENVVTETLKNSNVEAKNRKHVNSSPQLQQQDMSVKPNSLTHISGSAKLTSCVTARSFSDIGMQMQTCNKCSRLFGRKATYEKHVKICGVKSDAETGGENKSKKNNDNEKSLDIESLLVSTRSRGKGTKLSSSTLVAAVSSSSQSTGIDNISNKDEIENEVCSKSLSVIEIETSSDENDHSFPINLVRRNSEFCRKEKKEFSNNSSGSILNCESSKLVTRLKTKGNMVAFGDTLSKTLKKSINSPLSVDVDDEGHTELLIQERPRRKRKVPSRNIEAVDMLQKIHRTDETETSSEKRVKNSEIIKDSSEPAGRSDVRGVQKQNGHMQNERRGSVSRTKRRSSKIFISNNNKLECYNLLKVEKFMDVKKLKCRKCNSNFRSKATLKFHVVRSHLRWSRFQCKLCSFRCFHKSECSSHISRSHLKGRKDRNTPISNLIIDLSKKGSEAMTLKKHQTLKAKSQQQQKDEDSNIYKNQNTQKHLRLPERKLEKSAALNISPRKQQNESKKDVSSSSLDHDRNSPSSSAESNSEKERMSRRVIQVSHLVPRKPRLPPSTPQINAFAFSAPHTGSFNVSFDKSKSSDTSSSTSVSTCSKSDDEDASTRSVTSALSINNHSALSNASLKKTSLPFNISTRKSPRVFDTSPYNREEVNSTSTEEITTTTLRASSNNASIHANEVVMHTRHGTYTKTLPAIMLPGMRGSTKSTSDCKTVMQKDNGIVKQYSGNYGADSDDSEEEIVTLEESSDSDDHHNLDLESDSDRENLLVNDKL